MKNKLIWKYYKWMLPLLMLSACSDAGIMTDCPFHRFTFTLDVKHDLAGQYLKQTDSLTLEITFPDVLPDKETGEMINLERVPFEMALEFKEFNTNNSHHSIRFVDAKNAFSIRVVTGDSLPLSDQHRINTSGFLRAEGTIIVRPEKKDGMHKLKLSIQPRQEGTFALFWRMPNFQTDLYAVDLIYDEGCYERAVIEFRNPTRHNIDEYEPRYPPSHYGETRDSWINEKGAIFFRVP